MGLIGFQILSDRLYSVYLVKRWEKLRPRSFLADDSPGALKAAEEELEKANYRKWIFGTVVFLDVASFLVAGGLVTLYLLEKQRIPFVLASGGVLYAAFGIYHYFPELWDNWKRAKELRSVRKKLKEKSLLTHG